MATKKTTTTKKKKERRAAGAATPAAAAAAAAAAATTKPATLTMTPLLHELFSLLNDANFAKDVVQSTKMEDNEAHRECIYPPSTR